MYVRYVHFHHHAMVKILCFYHVRNVNFLYRCLLLMEDTSLVMSLRNTNAEGILDKLVDTEVLEQLERQDLYLLVDT